MQPAAYVMLAGAAVTLAAFGIAAVGGLFKLGKKLFGKKKAKPSDATPVAVGVGGAAVAAGALAVGGGQVPNVQPNTTPVVQAEEAMAYPSLEEAGFEVMPSAEEAAAAAGDPIAAPTVSAPVVSDTPGLSGDPIAPANNRGPAFDGMLPVMRQ